MVFILEFLLIGLLSYAFFGTVENVQIALLLYYARKAILYIVKHKLI